MPTDHRPHWYRHLRFTARRMLWDIRGDYEEPEYYLLPWLVDPTRAAIDVGANYGAYAGKAATLTRRVHCFEPNAEFAVQLRHRMPATVTVHRAAASNRNGTTDFFMPRSKDVVAAGALATIERRNPIVSDTEVERVTVDVVRLDDAVREPVGFLKIDVEGHEYAVVEGAERILDEDKPALLVESTPTSNAEAPQSVFDFLSRKRYAGFFLHHGRIRPLTAFKADLHQRLKPDGRMGKDYVFNFIFLPEE